MFKNYLVPKVKQHCHKILLRKLIWQEEFTSNKKKQNIPRWSVGDRFYHRPLSFHSQLRKYMWLYIYKFSILKYTKINCTLYIVPSAWFWCDVYNMNALHYPIITWLLSIRMILRFPRAKQGLCHYDILGGGGPISNPLLL